MCSGRLFHNVGAETLNECAVNVLHLVFGISKRKLDSDLSQLLVGFSTVMRFLRCSSALPSKHLYVRTSMLKAILYLIGNQCSSDMHANGLFDPLTVNLAQAFWTRWSLFNEQSGSP